MSGEDLKDLRAELGLTQSAVAAILQRTSTEVAEWELGTEAVPHEVALEVTRLHELAPALKAVVQDRPPAGRVYLTSGFERWVMQPLFLSVLGLVAISGLSFALLSLETGHWFFRLMGFLICFLAAKGIASVVVWAGPTCSACGRRMIRNRSECPDCGSLLLPEGS